MQIKHLQGKLEFSIEVTGMYITSVSYQTKSLVDTLYQHLQKSIIDIGNPFDSQSKNIRFVPAVAAICNNVFNSIKSIKSKYGDIIGLANIADNLYQAFTPYWRDHLLKKGQDILGIMLWHNILSITDEWERNNRPIKIHRGSLYYFLAENYLLVGDRELAYVYLYNAIEADKKLPKPASFYYYYTRAPAYVTATIKDDKNNHMYPLIAKLRKALQRYIKYYNRKFTRNYSIQHFDLKFLQNPSLSDTAHFFVFNFLYLFNTSKYAKTRFLKNEFSRLRSIDVFFNLCLIIDEILKLAYKQGNKVSTLNSHNLSQSISWLVYEKSWMKRGSLEVFWSKCLKINTTDPDVIIPQLLQMSARYHGKPVKKEIFTLLLAYKIRNYGGHNIRQQKVFASKYGEIVRQLLMAIFLSVEAL